MLYFTAHCIMIFGNSNHGPSIRIYSPVQGQRLGRGCIRLLGVCQRIPKKSTNSFCLDGSRCTFVYLCSLQIDYVVMVKV